MNIGVTEQVEVTHVGPGIQRVTGHGSGGQGSWKILGCA